MTRIALTHITKRFDATTVLNNLSLTAEPGEFLVVVGPSGCGKSTVLRLIAGLDAPTEGQITFDDASILGVSPKDRDVAMVFQNYALYPHMSVYDNLAFGLKMRKTPKAEIQQRVEEAATILELTPLLQRKPKQLSGGQRQRVALGRAIVRNPKVFLMDEPLSNLDAKLRVGMRREIRALHQRLGVTTVYVTHDQDEAMTMGQRIAVLNGGILQQCDTPEVVYQRPSNLFVAGFIGHFNSLPVQRGATRWQLSDGTPIGLTLSVNLPNNLILGFRPEAVESTNADIEMLHLPVQVTQQEYLGSHVRIAGTVAGQTVIGHWPVHQAMSEQVVFPIPRRSVLLFDAETQRRLDWQ